MQTRSGLLFGSVGFALILTAFAPEMLPSTAAGRFGLVLVLAAYYALYTLLADKYLHGPLMRYFEKRADRKREEVERTD